VRVSEQVLVEQMVVLVELLGGYVGGEQGELLTAGTARI
jgi:hypothetical protein